MRRRLKKFFEPYPRLYVLREGRFVRYEDSQSAHDDTEEVSDDGT